MRATSAALSEFSKLSKLILDLYGKDFDEIDAFENEAVVLKKRMNLL